MNLKCLQLDRSIPAIDRKRNRQVATVAFPSFQGRVATRKSTHKHHLENRTAKKLLAQFFGFGCTHAPIRAEELDRKNTVVGTHCGKAATSLNERFGTMAGVPRRKVLQNRKLSGSWQVYVARHCAKPLGRWAQFIF